MGRGCFRAYLTALDHPGKLRRTDSEDANAREMAGKTGPNCCSRGMLCWLQALAFPAIRPLLWVVCLFAILAWPLFERRTPK